MKASEQHTGHEQGHGQGEQRLVWGQMREGNVVVATMTVAVPAGTAAAGQEQEQEQEHQQLQE